jgi:hypothetical protein
MSSIFIEDACAIASKIEEEYDNLVQPSSTDKALILLYRSHLELSAQLEEAKKENANWKETGHWCIDETRQKTAREIIQYIIDQGTLEQGKYSKYDLYDIADSDITELKQRYGVE